MAPPFPEQIKIFVTFACNLLCGHCVHGRIREDVAASRDERFPEDLERFVAAAREEAPGLRVYLSGGEPLLERRFFQVARILAALGQPFKTITNGVLLGERLDELLAAPPDRLWVTFNGLGRRHDAVVGRAGTYESVRAALGSSLPRLYQAGVSVGAVLLVNRLTHDRLARDVETLAGFGLDEVVVQHLSFLPPEMLSEHRARYREAFGAESAFCFGEGASGEGIDPSVVARELAAISAGSYPCPTPIFPPIRGREALADYYGPTPERWRSRRCERAGRELWVLPDGSVTACFAHPVGRVGDGYREIVASRAWRDWVARMRERPEPLPGCARCHRLYLDPGEAAPA